MNGLPYYKRYPRDFIEGTLDLPFEVKAAYAILLDLIYLQAGKLPDNDRYISGVLGVSIRKWKSLRAALIQADKLQVGSDYLTNYRAVSELETLSKLSANQAEKRLGFRKNKDLQKPQLNHTEPEPDIKEEEGKPSSKKKRGSRLPENWVLPKAYGEWAVSEGYAENVIRLEAEKFRDYWIGVSGQKGVKLDWLATWRNWMRNQPKLKTINGGQYGPQPSDSTDRLQRIVSAGAGGTSRKDWG